MTNQKLEGGCQCGAIRYQITGEPLMSSICHCAICRRASATSSMAWAMFRKPQVTFLQGDPARFTSSAGGERGFCSACGTQLCLTATFLPGLIDITLGSLDHPEAITPVRHYWGTRRLPWTQFAYSLPRSHTQESAENIAG
jgi:hypothetical protein